MVLFVLLKGGLYKRFWALIGRALQTVRQGQGSAVQRVRVYMNSAAFVQGGLYVSTLTPVSISTTTALFGLQRWWVQRFATNQADCFELWNVTLSLP